MYNKVLDSRLCIVGKLIKISPSIAKMLSDVRFITMVNKTKHFSLLGFNFM